MFEKEQTKKNCGKLIKENHNSNKYAFSREKKSKPVLRILRCCCFFFYKIKSYLSL
jgi:hypothetical protein